MTNKKIHIANNFQPSVNIAYDLNNDEIITKFIPTVASIEIIEEIMLSLGNNSTQRARILIGAYGKGKSHIILVLLAMLHKKDLKLFSDILLRIQQIKPELHDYIGRFIKSSDKLMPIVVSGSSASLTQSFLSALQQALSRENLNDLMPDTHFEAAINTIENWRVNYQATFNNFSGKIDIPIADFILKLKEYDIHSYENFEKIYPEITAGSTFNPFLGFDVVELYEKVVDKIQSRGYKGIFVIYDEFSKYLESSISNATISDIKLLQDFAEKCDRSGNKQMHLMLISHKDISNYIDNGLPKGKVDGWRGVSGRFKHLNIQNNYSQIYEIISSIIKKEESFWEEFTINNEDKFNEVRYKLKASGLIDKEDEDAINEIIFGCYPLHPIATFILPRLSEKIAQNERTLFTFLAAKQKHTLSEFLNKSDDDFNLLTPDYLYDYFEPLLQKESYLSDIHKQYKLSKNILKKLDYNSLEAKIVKTLSLIYIIEHFELLEPTIKNITEIYTNNGVDYEMVADALDNLMKKECIVYLRRSNNYLKLKESTGININAEIEKGINKIKNNKLEEEILNSINFENYLYPTRYNDNNDIIRYFEFKFINSQDLDKFKDYEHDRVSLNSDGIILAVLLKEEDELDDVKQKLLQNEFRMSDAVFITPKVFTSMSNHILEYMVIKGLRDSVTEDILLREEYDIYLEDIENIVFAFILSYTRPEMSKSQYYYKGEKRNFTKKSQLTLLLSEICEEVYFNTPIINNEQINKNEISSIANKSRSKLVSAILESELKINLGMTGTGQEISIMRSALVNTGILINLDSSPSLNLSPADDKLRFILDTIKDFFTGDQDSELKRFIDLYNKLLQPEFGVGIKKGLIPIYIAVVLHYLKGDATIISNGSEEKTNADLLNAINENPANYVVMVENWNYEKLNYIKKLEDIFFEYINEKEKSFNSYLYIVAGMNRWYMSLPKYSKEIEIIHEGQGLTASIVPIEMRRFLGLLRNNSNPRDLLFEKFLVTFNTENLEILAEKIEESKRFYDSVLKYLTHVLTNDVKKIFNNFEEGATLKPILKDWYEGLNISTRNHIFSNGENCIFDIIDAISYDDNLTIQKLSKAITGLRTEDWTSDTPQNFIERMNLIKKNIEEFNNKDNVKGEEIGLYKIMFVGNDGGDQIKSFAKTEYSAKAKLLLNDINASIEEMGQSISNQEKRQVLMELLEKLC